MSANVARSMEASRIIDRCQKGHRRDSSHAWYGHQAAAGRAFADHIEHHFVKDSALLPEGSAGEHGAHFRFKVRRLSYQLENARLKWAGCDPPGEPDPKYPQGSADLVFNVNLFDQQRPSVREQHSDHLTDLTLHVDNRVPADTHAMGDRPGVVPIIFDPHGLGDCAEPTRINANRGHAPVSQSAVEPCGGRTGLEPHSLEGKAKLIQPICDLIWIGCRNALSDNHSVLGDGTDRGGRKRDVQTNIVLHGALLRILGSEGDRATSVIR